MGSWVIKLISYEARVMEQYVNFFVGDDLDSKPQLDVNDERARVHLKALLCGLDSNTENIVIDFSLNHTGMIDQYSRFEEAWQQLDVGLRDFIAAFRNLSGKSYINPHREDFVKEFFCDLVQNSVNKDEARESDQ